MQVFFNFQESFRTQLCDKWHLSIRNKLERSAMIKQQAKHADKFSHKLSTINESYNLMITLAIQFTKRAKERQPYYSWH